MNQTRNENYDLIDTFCFMFYNSAMLCKYNQDKNYNLCTFRYLFDVSNKMFENNDNAFDFQNVLSNMFISIRDRDIPFEQFISKMYNAPFIRKYIK